MLTVVTYSSSARMIYQGTPLNEDAGHLIFTNLLDFDSLYGHRRDIEGYAASLSAFDELLPALLAALRPGDCLMLTADHGNDPGFPGTDHTRERHQHRDDLRGG